MRLRAIRLVGFSRGGRSCVATGWHNYRIRWGVCRRKVFSIPRILAVVPFGELTHHSLVTPDFPPGTLGRREKMVISFDEVTIDREHRFLDTSVVAIMNDRPCHPAENRLDYIQKL
jgi:hypothetical protein